MGRICNTVQRLTTDIHGQNNESVWYTIDQRRFFLIPHVHNLPNGKLSLHTATGRSMQIDLDTVAPYEITRDEAEAWLTAQLGDVLGALRTNAIAGARGFFARRSPAAHETPPELVAHAAAIETVAGWLQPLSARGAARLRTTATALRTRAADAQATPGAAPESEP